MLRNKPISLRSELTELDLCSSNRDTKLESSELRSSAESMLLESELTAGTIKCVSTNATKKEESVLTSSPLPRELVLGI
jgi:hypothetical protein